MIALISVLYQYLYLFVATFYLKNCQCFLLMDREESRLQLFAAYTMLPGLLTGIYYFTNPENHWIVRVAGFGYCIPCIGAYLYHRQRAYDPPDAIQKGWLRFDITCQQIGVYLPGLLTQHGLASACVASPLILATWIGDLRHRHEVYIVGVCHALTVIIFSFCADFRCGILSIVWFASTQVPTKYWLSLSHIIGALTVSHGYSLWNQRLLQQM